MKTTYIVAEHKFTSFFFMSFAIFFPIYLFFFCNFSEIFLWMIDQINNKTKICVFSVSKTITQYQESRFVLRNG